MYFIYVQCVKLLSTLNSIFFPSSVYMYVCFVNVSQCIISNCCSIFRTCATNIIIGKDCIIIIIIIVTLFINNNDYLNLHVLIIMLFFLSWTAFPCIVLYLIDMQVFIFLYPVHVMCNNNNFSRTENNAIIIF